MMKYSAPKRPWLPFVPVLCIYLPLVLWYSFVVPVFEAPDESAHYGVAQLMSTTGRLTVLDYESPGDEEHQPPLYYALVASVLRLSAADDAPPALERNPHAAVSTVDSLGNKNAFLHGDTAEQWPFRNLPRAVHLARLVSVAFGVLTVVATYGIALSVFGQAWCWLAAASAAVVAFTPQFVFISGAINNDTAVAALSALVLWLVVVYGEKSRSMRWLVALGVAGGLASLTKAGGLAAVAFIVIALVVKAFRSRQLKYLWLEVVVAVAVSALTAGWWYARNLALYGDPFLWRYITRWYSGARPQDFGQLLRRFWEGLPSYWGVFGWLNIAWPDWIYRLLSVLTVAAGLGLVVFLIRYVRGRREGVNPFALGMVLLWTCLSLAAVSRWIMVAGGLQGRLLFPAISALSVLLILGWISLFPTRWQQRAAAVWVAGLLVLALVTPPVLLVPAYAQPRLLDPEQAPRGMIPTSLRIGNAVELVGYRTEPSVAQPGAIVKIILYWRVSQPVERDFSTFVTLLGRGLRDIGSINTFPGLGALPTSRWPAGKVIEDVYPIRIDADAEAPALITISTGWYDDTTHEGPDLVDPQGVGTTFVGKFKLAPAQWPPTPQTTLANFANQIRLASYAVTRSDSQSINLSLEWVCQAKPGRDLTVFAHVLDKKGTSLALKDQPPLAGDYGTSAWEPGEVIQDRMVIPMPVESNGSDARGIEIGLYDPTTGERLSVLDKSGQVIGTSVTLPMSAR